MESRSRDGKSERGEIWKERKKTSKEGGMDRIESKDDDTDNDVLQI